VDKLGCPAIAARLNADPAACPPPNPGAGWTAQNVRVILANPKYTGHMVYGRHRTRNGRRTPAPQDQWLWSPAPVHPAIVDRATWDAAQDAAGGHGTSRDGDEPNSHPATARSYPYRSRIRCRDCRRMAGTTYGHPAAQSTYYRCPHNPATPRHAASCPDHPRTVQAPELLLDQIVGQFFADRIFGPGRAALLAAQLPATDAGATAAHDAQAAQLQARIRRIETAQNSQILELEQLPADPADTASAAMRARIRARFADLHHEREQIDTQLTTLAKTTPAAAGPALLDQLPLAGDILPGLPPALKARLFTAFGLEILWNKPGQQATVFAEITENTLQAIPGILNPSQDGYHDTGNAGTHADQPEPMWDLGNTPRSGRESHPPVPGTARGTGSRGGMPGMPGMPGDGSVVSDRPWSAASRELAGPPGAAQAAADHRQVGPVPRLAVEEGPDPPGEVGPALGGERDHPAVRAEQPDQFVLGHRQRVLHRVLLDRGHRGTGREHDLAAPTATGPAIRRAVRLA